MTSQPDPLGEGAEFPFGKLESDYRPMSPSDDGRWMAEIVRITQDAIARLLDGGAKGGVSWLKGKGDQEVAKAFEILSQAQERLSRISIERERLAMERKESEMSSERAQEAHDEEMRIKRTERILATLERLTAVIKSLEAAGVQTLKIEQVLTRLMKGLY